uniref:G-protein coupled receptors family 1 profile domain-containing protein n=1 Tax=Stomoxys calcitrans TaxID=35570 RepID=A0A1I8PJW2_STOCA
NALQVKIAPYTTYSKQAAAAPEAILSGPLKAVAECLVCRFTRPPYPQAKRSEEETEEQRRQRHQRQKHKHGIPFAAKSTIPKRATTKTTEPNRTTKTSQPLRWALSAAARPIQCQNLGIVFIVLVWLLTFNVGKVSAVDVSAAVTFPNKATATLLHATTILSHSDNLIASLSQNVGVLQTHGHNNEVLYAESDEVTTNDNRLNSTPPTPIVYPTTSFNDSITASNSSSNATFDSEVPEIPAYIRTTAMVLCIVIMLMGVIGNVMVPIVIIRTKDMRNSTNIFLTNLSIADLLVLLVCTPTVLVELNTKPETWILGHEMCKAVPFIELTVAHASVLTILAISFERYYAICEPLKAGYVCTKTRAILICSLAWGIAALFTSPIFWISEYKFLDYIDGSSVPVCLTQALTIWTLGFFLMTTMVFFICPLLILIVLYGVIAKNLISDTGTMMRIRPIKPELSLKARKQVVLMLGAVVLSFFLCLLPFRLLTLCIILTPDRIHDLGVERYYNLLYFCRIMFYLNSAINPILYNLMSTKFRKGFYKLICSVWLSLFTSVTCGYCGACGKMRGVNAMAIITTTSNSNTNTTTNTSSSILSRSSNRRSSDEVCNRTRVQIQMQMPCGSDCEMVAMLHSNSTSVVAASLPALNKYGATKAHPQRRSSSSSIQTGVNAPSLQHSHHHHPHQHHRHVACSRLKAKHISFEEDAAMA